ncbi:TM2 domain-containing protein [Tessaracoccus sp. MC1679]|nr:TM2 domain-containing protein [Tessaracoccus sp. MC1679]
MFGMFGADRFYLGKTRSAMWKLLTLGGFGYWWIIDLVITLFGGQRDNEGLRLEGYDRHKKTVWKVLGAVLAGALALNFVALVGLASYDGNGLTAVGWSIVGGGALATAIVVGRQFLNGRRRRNLEAAALEDAPVPPAIQAHLDKLSSLRQEYVPHAAAGDETAAVVVSRLESLINNAGELFRRLQGKANKSQRGIAQTEYEDKLGRIAAAVDRDYLLDILANPRLWEDSDKRIKGVQAALAAVDDQVLENVRQVNALKGLVFEVSVDGLLDPFRTEGR